MEWVAFITTFLLVLAVELPDKTLMATLMLSSRYRPWPVLLGVSAAFAVQSTIAVLAGSILTLLPEAVTYAVVSLLFGIGAFILFRESLRTQEQAKNDERVNAAGWRIALTSFGVLFAAEWGDASQLATAALAARYEAPLSVFLGSFIALVSVAAIAVALGRTVLRYLPIRWIHRGGATIFMVFSIIAFFQLIQAL